ncbi:MAG: flagellar protein [Lachnospiraceae bacterium]|nr:flagellar protein [Lachnospiraceae bacterium]
MDVKNCRTCGRLFNYISGRQMCPACRAQLEEKFQEVKKYVEENKNATLSQVAEEMDVPVRQLKDWIREERLILSDAWGEIVCDSCGKAIVTGRFCVDCKRNMANKLGDVYRTEKKSNSGNSLRKDAGARMRFFDN